MVNERNNSVTALRRNERGVALLIVLLVTALLIALIFEFAYATRISLNTAVNFRDSQRAYYLAQSGINAFSKYGGLLRDAIPQGEWHPVPMLGEGESTVMIKWEDESGKIKVSDVKTNAATSTIVKTLLETVNGIDTTVLDRMTAPESQISNLKLLSGIREYMNDEEYIKVQDALTVEDVSMNKVTINVNTASREVLQSLGIGAEDAEMIINDRQTDPFTQQDLNSGGRLARLESIPPIGGLNVFNHITVQSKGIYKVIAHAKVGEYEKQVVAVLNGASTVYWKSL